MSGISMWEDEDGTMHFSCGCEAKVIESVFVFKPCSTDCDVYLYMLEQSKSMGHPVKTMIVGDKVDNR